MVAEAKRGRPGVISKREVIVGFSAEAVRAPMLLRAGAMLLDYTLIVAFPVIFLLFGRIAGEDGTGLLSGSWMSAGWLMGLVFALLDLIVLPALSGQTIGKMAAGLRVVGVDGASVAGKRMALRQTVGYLANVATLGIGFVIGAFSSRGRALHDILFGTIVIYATRRDARSGT